MKSESTFTRARQPDQKEERKQQILAAAAALLGEEGIESVSLNAIAREAKVAKSNVYRYFESREEIFLQLLKQDWETWMSQLEDSLQPYQGSDDIDGVTEVLVTSVCRADRMCHLISVLTSVLERNLTEDTLYAFKTESIALSVRLVALIVNALPGLTPANVMPAIHSIFALIGGLWPLCNPGAQVKNVLKHPELAPFKLDYQDTLKESVRLVLRGAVQ